jgi:hypothetical protein
VKPKLSRTALVALRTRDKGTAGDSPAAERELSLLQWDQMVVKLGQAPHRETTPPRAHNAQKQRTRDAPSESNTLRRDEGDKIRVLNVEDAEELARAMQAGWRRVGILG